MWLKCVLRAQVEAWVRKTIRDVVQKTGGRLEDEPLDNDSLCTQVLAKVFEADFDGVDMTFIRDLLWQFPVEPAAAHMPHIGPFHVAAQCALVEIDVDARGSDAAALVAPLVAAAATSKCLRTVRQATVALGMWCTQSLGSTADVPEAVQAAANGVATQATALCAIAKTMRDPKVFLAASTVLACVSRVADVPEDVLGSCVRGLLRRVQASMTACELKCVTKALFVCVCCSGNPAGVVAAVLDVYKGVDEPASGASLVPNALTALMAALCPALGASRAPTVCVAQCVDVVAAFVHSAPLVRTALAGLAAVASTVRSWLAGALMAHHLVVDMHKTAATCCDAMCDAVDAAVPQDTWPSVVVACLEVLLSVVTASPTVHVTRTGAADFADLLVRAVEADVDDAATATACALMAAILKWAIRQRVHAVFVAFSGAQVIGTLAEVLEIRDDDFVMVKNVVGTLRTALGMWPGATSVVSPDMEVLFAAARTQAVATALPTLLRVAADGEVLDKEGMAAKVMVVEVVHYLLMSSEAAKLAGAIAEEVAGDGVACVLARWLTVELTAPQTKVIGDATWRRFRGMLYESVLRLGSIVGTFTGEEEDEEKEEHQFVLGEAFKHAAKSLTVVGVATSTVCSLCDAGRATTMVCLPCECGPVHEACLETLCTATAPCQCPTCGKNVWSELNEELDSFLF